MENMSKSNLRTLKDLKFRSIEIKDRLNMAIIPHRTAPNNEWFVCEGNLKKEAIKWVKEDKEATKRLHPDDMGTWEISIRMWMKRLDITEEDLK